MLPAGRSQKPVRREPSASEDVTDPSTTVGGTSPGHDRQSASVMGESLKPQVRQDGWHVQPGR